MMRNICIHKYIQQCKTNSQSPGFGDFLRGTVSLYQYCKKYNYDIYLDTSSHELFQYLNHNPYFIDDSTCSEEVLELIPGTKYQSYEHINSDLEKLFKNNIKNIRIITNAFYHNSLNQLINWDSLENYDTKKFMQTILQPNNILNNKLYNIFTNIYKIPIDSKYLVVHIRTGDKYIHFDKNLDPSIITIYLKKLLNIIETYNNLNVILVTDSCKLGNICKNHIPKLLYWDNQKIHMGDRKNVSNILDTLIDFFIIYNSNLIISNISTFSRSCSIINNIPIINIE